MKEGWFCEEVSSWILEIGVEVVVVVVELERLKGKEKECGMK